MVKAAVLYNFGEALAVDSLELRAPNPDEVVVKLAASGVCRSDLSVQQAKLPFPPPVVLGHEGAGTVEEVGRDVKHLQPGDHVVLSAVENCGRCHYCIAGKVHLCDAMMHSLMTGGELIFEKDGTRIARMSGVGSFSERTVVRATAAIKIGADVPLDRACLVGCAVMTGVGAAVNTAKVQPGDVVAVFGCGGVGLNVIQGAALGGAARIIAVDLAPAKLALAQTFGATDLVNGGDGNPSGQIRALTDGRGVDYAFEVIGLPAATQEAFFSLKRGGKVIVVGVAATGQMVEIPSQMISAEEKSIIGSLYGSANMQRDMPRLIDLYRRGKLKLDELVSKRITLADVNAAFADMERGDVARSVIVF
jgi:S-(hydroxymethyl)glutathione dehydrogenase/alcohol dehydrogenase